MSGGRQLVAFLFAVATALPVHAASLDASARTLPLQHQTVSMDALVPPVQWELAPLVNFKSSDIKFNLQAMMDTLRDNRHEGWVLAAYPDPKTTRPLIGAGFSLDLAERTHTQTDPLNPNTFLEPSSAQLWEAAGLPPAQLQTMLAQYDRELDAWSKRRFQRKVRAHALFPEISEDDAMKLLRISSIQAIHNARAYCRNFDELTGPQQMALSQLVFQMGVNLEQFTNFLSAINSSPDQIADAGDYWHSVQGTLTQTDWARRYSVRAVSVIAMFDPTYGSDPEQAEAKVKAEVHPLYRHSRHRARLKTASLHHKKNAARRTRKS